MAVRKEGHLEVSGRSEQPAYPCYEYADMRVYEHVCACVCLVVGNHLCACVCVCVCVCARVCVIVLVYLRAYTHIYTHTWKRERRLRRAETSAMAVLRRAETSAMAVLRRAETSAMAVLRRAETSAMAVLRGFMVIKREHIEVTSGANPQRFVLPEFSLHIHTYICI
jgi:hypothetical protein